MSVELPVLEETCPLCMGAGEIMDGSLEKGIEDCGGCNGSGLVPTEAGKSVLQLLSHNVKTKTELSFTNA